MRPVIESWNRIVDGFVNCVTKLASSNPCSATCDADCGWLNPTWSLIADWVAAGWSASTTGLTREFFSIIRHDCSVLAVNKRLRVLLICLNLESCYCHMGLLLSSSVKNGEIQKEHAGRYCISYCDSSKWNGLFLYSMRYVRPTALVALLLKGWFHLISFHYGQIAEVWSVPLAH